MCYSLPPQRPQNQPCTAQYNTPRRKIRPRSACHSADILTIPRSRSAYGARSAFAPNYVPFESPTESNIGSNTIRGDAVSLAAWITIAVIIVVILALMTNRISPDVAMLGGLTILMLVDQIFPSISIIEPLDAIKGFSHRAIIMIAGLFIVAAGLGETGATEMIAQKVLGRPKSATGALLRLMIPVAGMSAFMNNTAVVAMYMPIVSDWAKKMRISPSKLFIPLSYAAILGGTCTLIATASNLTVDGLYEEYLQNNPAIQQSFNLTKPAFWGVSLVGLPVTVAGIAFVIFTAKWMLPDRIKPLSDASKGERQYRVEMLVTAGSPIIGKTIEGAGLRHLPGLYLSAIERPNEILTAVGPDVRIRENDQLVFVGVIESVVDLKKIRGLVPATDEVRKVKTGRRNRTIVEAVVSRTSPLVGRSVRQSKFRTVYNAAIIAVHRYGQHIDKKVGDIVLQPGDVLLLETHIGFVNAYRNCHDFYLVSKVEGAREIRHERAWLSVAILGLMVVLLIFTPIDKIAIILFSAGLMVFTRCCTGTIARNSINIQVLVVIAAALGIGKAMENTGAAASLASMLTGIASGLPPAGLVFLVFILTSLFAQLITNNGAAVLMFPVAMQICVAPAYGISPEPFMFAIMIAAACNFATPIAYQTNLMVYGPGEYRFTDFCRIGIPLTLVAGVITSVLAPIFFPF